MLVAVYHDHRARVRCRKLAATRGYEISGEHVFSDEAASGARSDRSGLSALRTAAELGAFQAVLVDDLSRLARNTLLMLSILEELRFHGIRVVSVADGLDTDDEESTIGKSRVYAQGMALIVAVDDEPGIQAIYETIYRDAGFEYVGFNNGDVALSALESLVPDLITTDRRQPGMGGIRFVAALKRSDAWCRIPVVFITACGEETVFPELRAEGVDPDRELAGFVQKPFLAEQILEIVRTVLARSTSGGSMSRDAMVLPEGQPR